MGQGCSRGQGGRLGGPRGSRPKGEVRGVHYHQRPRLMGPLMICKAIQVILRIHWGQVACFGVQGG